ncbi:MAG: hypothetical protein ABIR58_08195 [Gemmatimonadaceae bacterium]
MIVQNARILRFLLGIVLAGPVAAQTPDSLKQDTTFSIASLLDRDDRGGITITSGKAYNRVEGLPILIGPTYRTSQRDASVSVSALGIIRSAHGFHWDSENLGHRLTAEVRLGRRRGITVGASSFDEVVPIERWQLGEPDAGLAGLFLKRDYLDYYGRHGGRLHASVFAGENAMIGVGYSDERWSSRRERDVFSLFRGDESWRINPRVDDGRMHVANIRADVDSRNSELNPLAGWFVSLEYERGSGRLDLADISRIPVGQPTLRDVTYGRGFLDLRRYNRISPARQLNARLVLGGWLHGSPLPVERRFSVGGVGTIPGFDFRRIMLGTDVGQCNDDPDIPAGRPARCERVALAQLEYRHELHSELIDVFNRNRIRVRGAGFRVRPSAVLFADAGRGWLLGDRDGTLTYPSGSLPSFDTFRTDVGLGLDLGIVGLYVAKAVSASKEPANFFVRLRNRF